jgi:hypothetical protein
MQNCSFKKEGGCIILKIAYHPDRVRNYIMQRISQSKASHRYYLRKKGELPEIEVYSPDEALGVAGL